FTQPGEFAEQAKTKFLQAVQTGSTPDGPEFTYPKLDLTTLLTWRDDMTVLLGAASASDLDNEVNRLIREKITNSLAEVDIMLLTRLQSDTDPETPSYPLISFQLGENMKEVYGKPSSDEFRRVLDARLTALKPVLDMTDIPDEITEAADHVRAIFPWYQTASGAVYQPQSETMQWYARELQRRCNDATQAVRQAIEDGSVQVGDDDELDSAALIKTAQIALNARGYTDWQAKPTTNTNVDTSQADQTIYIPEKRRMNFEEFDKLINGHEIDQHVGRRVNGDATGVAILGGLGCSDYLQWEEGAGKANETLLSGKVLLEGSAFGFFLSGGLIMGLDREGTGRNFGDTFDIVWRLNLLEQFSNGKVGDDVQTVISELQTKAYDHLRRLFRGTDGKVTGVFYPKDAVNYYLGQVEVWRKWDKDMQGLDEEARRVEYKLESSAKINPQRADHHRVAEAAIIGIETD
ncbi:hypothetical protein HY218_00475, partial [Candidatus Saccharibacteria bacterium]|nr:hypothetical protein [Candidatus Saccharibacteria bacterium]